MSDQLKNKTIEISTEIAEKVIKNKTSVKETEPHDFETVSEPESNDATIEFELLSSDHHNTNFSKPITNGPNDTPMTLVLKTLKQ